MGSSIGSITTIQDLPHDSRKSSIDERGQFGYLRVRSGAALNGVRSANTEFRIEVATFNEKTKQLNMITKNESP